MRAFSPGPQVQKLTTALLKSHYSHQLPSTAMAMCSSFCPQIPNQLRARPICPFTPKPQFSLSIKALSSQASNASAKGTFFIYPDAFLMGIHFFSFFLFFFLE
jgi:hypothetical protein